MEDINLEDIAMGKLPKVDKKGVKLDTISSKVKAGVKKMADMVLAQEGMSIKSLKKFNKSELKIMLKTADKLQDSLYRTKEMLREAMPRDVKGKEDSMVGSCC